jgi:hypothetical protein
MECYHFQPTSFLVGQNLKAHCKVLEVLPTDYNSKVLTVASGSPAPITFFGEIININDIDDKIGQVTVTLSLQIQWNDFRLTFLNLNPDPILNTLSPAEYESIWQPDVIFKGQAHKRKY